MTYIIEVFAYQRWQVTWLSKLLFLLQFYQVKLVFKTY